ncbi:Protein farnesyltransferase subunit beta [Zancudomyces culisetae]|uniref:Protein farnesyltransferase subunit beta n=1 Tax=Zancudomyces culisetae TaxID=1213189 RepID=A0A1R1PI47_ZANCU|nr:Protein farnesyltransferase subunit beta [Zancudomyces culisetae]|eukprot:OMH80583.1 Protein farnesyltransferase subunit beta [Zancudomyces culisetae]
MCRTLFQDQFNNNSIIIIININIRCQNYDGGFGPYPGVESHGGYSLCASASVAILDCFECIDMDRFLVSSTNTRNERYKAKRRI